VGLGAASLPGAGGVSAGILTRARRRRVLRIVGISALVGFNFGAYAVSILANAVIYALFGALAAMFGETPRT
jgi:hypothetical protein